MLVLIVEDRPQMARLIQEALEGEGFSTLVAFDGERALQLSAREPVDLVVLDIMLPGKDGLTVMRQLREQGRYIPAMILTALDANEDIIKGLDSGADDYLTKPFDLDIFLARMRALTRRAPVSRPARVATGNFVLDTGEHTLSCGERSIGLTKTEFALLEILMRAAGRVVTHGVLLDAAWGVAAEATEDTLYVFIRKLRRKLEAPGALGTLQTHRGLGYSFRIQS